MRKLIIVGCVDECKNIPYDDTGYNIWALARNWKAIEKGEMKRVDLLWEIHTLKSRDKESLNYYKKCNISIMLQDHCEGILYGQKYPLDKIINKFGRRYFACSLCYVIAYAMYLGYHEIHLYGVNMMLDDHFVQRYSVEYWLGRAEQSGIKLVLQDDCDLLQSPKIYGYEVDNTFGVYINKIIKEMDDYNLKALEEVLHNLKKLKKDKKIFMEEVFERQGLNLDKERS